MRCGSWMVIFLHFHHSPDGQHSMGSSNILFLPKNSNGIVWENHKNGIYWPNPIPPLRNSNRLSYHHQPTNNPRIIRDTTTTTFSRKTQEWLPPNLAAHFLLHLLTSWSSSYLFGSSSGSVLWPWRQEQGIQIHHETEAGWQCGDLMNSFRCFTALWNLFISQVWQPLGRRPEQQRASGERWGSIIATA